MLEHVTEQEQYPGVIQKDSPNIIKGLTPYQILEKLTSLTYDGKGRDEVCWKERITYDGSAFISLDSYQFSPRRTYVHQSFTRKLRQESGYIDVFSQKD